MKTRSDSLYAKLTPEQREQVFYMLLVENVSLADVDGHIHDWGIATSVQAVSKMLQVHGLGYRLELARETAEATEQLELGDINLQARQGLQKRLFQATFENLSVKEAVLLKRADLDERKEAREERKLALEESKFHWGSAEKVLAMVRKNPKLLHEVVHKKALTEEQRIQKIIAAMWTGGQETGDRNQGTEDRGQETEEATL